MTKNAMVESRRIERFYDGCSDRMRPLSAMTRSVGCAAAALFPS
jgi:hypothetical protein